MLIVWIDNAVTCPRCGCEETSLAFREGEPPRLVCVGCEGQWPVVIGVVGRVAGEEGPRDSADEE